MEDTTVRYAGVDWASASHAICIVGEDGEVAGRFEVAHRAGDLTQMCRRLIRAGASRVAIERPDGPVVDALMEAGIEVVVIASRQVKALGSATARPATRTTPWMPMSLPTACAPMAVAFGHSPPTRPRP